MGERVGRVEENAQKPLAWLTNPAARFYDCPRLQQEPVHARVRRGDANLHVVPLPKDRLQSYQSVILPSPRYRHTYCNCLLPVYLVPYVSRYFVCEGCYSVYCTYVQKLIRLRKLGFCRCRGTRRIPTRLFSSCCSLGHTLSHISNPSQINIPVSHYHC